MRKPIHEHDCDGCVFLGTFIEEHEKNPVDYWVHPNNESKPWVSLIRRFTSEPSDNASFPLMPGESVRKDSCGYGVYSAFLAWNGKNF